MIFAYVIARLKYAIRYDQKGILMPFSEWFRLSLGNLIAHGEWGDRVYWECGENGWIREVPIQREAFPAPPPLTPNQKSDTYLRRDWRIQMLLHWLRTGRWESAYDVPIIFEPFPHNQEDVGSFPQNHVSGKGGGKFRQLRRSAKKGCLAEENMLEDNGVNTIEALSDENKRLKDELREFRVLANLASVISWLEADADKQFKEAKQLREELSDLTVLCKSQEEEIERLKWSGKPWSGKKDVG
jgi:hypothetical protein